MNLMDTKVFREIKTEKFRSIMIVSIVAVTVALMIGMRASYPMIMETYKANMVAQNVADGRFTFTAPVLENNVSVIEGDTAFLDENNIGRIEGRVIIQTNIFYNGDKFQAVIIGVDFPNKINQLNIEQASSDIDIETNFLKSNPYCIMESRFAGDLLGQDMSLGDKIKIDLFGTEIESEIKAIGSDVDFLYVVDPASQMTLMGQMAVVWVDIGLLQQYLFGGMPLVNQILFTVEDRLNRQMTLDAADELSLRFATNGIDISAMEFTIFDETIDRKFFDADAGSIDKMGTIFGIIGLIVCAVAIFNSLSRIVQGQRRNIGLFMSLGAKRQKIIGHYLKITMILAGIGAVIGMPLGYLLSVGMTRMVVRLYAWSVFVYPITISEYFINTAVCLGVCAVFSEFSAWPITTATPREAMSAFFNRIKVTSQTVSEKLFGWIPRFRALYMLVPIREIFLRKKKTAISILAISTSMIILINSVAMVANMYSSMTENYTKYNTADVQIKLETPMAISDIESIMEDQFKDDIDHFEVFISIYTKLHQNGDFLSWIELQCYQQDSTLRNFNVVEGDVTSKDQLSNDKILLGKSLAGKYDIVLGDSVAIGTVGNYSVEVEGIVGEMIDYAALWTIESFSYSNISDYFGLPKNYVNGILLKIPEGVDRGDLRDKIEGQFAVSQWLDADQSQQSVMTLMQNMFGILFMFLLIGVAIGVTFSFNTMYMGFLSRENDFLAFKAMGTDNKYIRKMIFWENALLSIFSLLLTIPIGYLFYWWSMDYMIGDRMYISIEIPWYTWIMVFFINLFSIWLATRKLMKKVNKMVLADELRQRTVS